MIELHNIYNFIISEKLILPKDSILVAVSGGIDSVSLLDVLFKLKEKLLIKKLSVAHFNHKLRNEESKRDEVFVKNLAESYKLDFFTEESNIKELSKSSKLSVQESARNYRLDFLERIAVKSNSNYIATGHNSDDLAETSLMWLFRGTSLDGIKGIPVRRGKFIRPLLLTSRKDIKEYVSNNKLLYVEDSSNSKNDYTRNYIRNSLFPIIEENIYKNAKENISKFANSIKDDVDYLEKITARYEKKYVKDVLFGKIIDLNSFSKIHISIQKRLIKNMIRYISNNETKNISSTHINDIIKLGTLSSSGSKSINLPNDLTASRIYKNLKISKTSKISVPPKSEYELNFPGVTVIDEYALTITCSVLPGGKEIENYNLSKKGFAYFDLEKIKFPLKIRLAEHGDKFCPLGTIGEQKLSDFFIDKKIPADIRWITPVIVAEKDIIWLLSHRINENYKVSYSSKNVLQITYKNM